MGGWSSIYVGVFKMRRLLSNSELANDVANAGSHSWQFVSEGSVLMLLLGELWVRKKENVTELCLPSVKTQPFLCLSSLCGEQSSGEGRGCACVENWLRDSESEQRFPFGVSLRKKSKRAARQTQAPAQKDFQTRSDVCQLSLAARWAGILARVDRSVLPFRQGKQDYCSADGRN